MRNYLKHAVRKLILSTGYDLIKLDRYGMFPPGHYYSPVPNPDEVYAHITNRKKPLENLPGIDLNKKGQLELLEKFSQLYKDIQFPENMQPDHRYYYNNEAFSYGDAIFLNCFLRVFSPRRIIEIGAGFSSAVMLDTADAFFTYWPDFTFIEPNPDRLKGLMKDGDAANCSLVDKPIQEVANGFFQTLKSGDFLFIDSSHVVKTGSDLQFIFYEILPILNRGVFVHFHDIFYPFEYPITWLEEGRYWNENYMLRAFLSFNAEWRICFFNSYVDSFFGNILKERMPLTAINPGGGVYLQRL